MKIMLLILGKKTATVKRISGIQMNSSITIPGVKYG
jgi:hypothetical protein